MRRSVFALILVLVLAFAAPSAAAPLDDYKNNGSIPQCKYPEKQLGGELGDLPPDIEQYAPGYADELRGARGGGCGSGSSGGSGSAGGTTSRAAQDRVEDVPGPGSVDGGSGSGSGGSGGGSGQVKVNTPPAPEPEKRTRLANVTSPAVNATPTGPDVPTWALILMAATLLIGSAAGVLYLLGADFGRFTRPVGAAAGEARARTSDRAVELWETVRFGR